MAKTISVQVWSPATGKMWAIHIDGVANDHVHAAALSVRSEVARATYDAYREGFERGLRQGAAKAEIERAVTVVPRPHTHWWKRIG